jgi:hypothetical protein
MRTQELTTLTAAAAVGLMLAGCGSSSTQSTGADSYAEPDTVTAASLIHGLSYAYYWGTTPTDGRYPRFIGRVDTVGVLDSLAPAALPRYDKDTANATQYRGYVEIPSDAEYVFSAVDSAAGSTVSLAIGESAATGAAHLALAAGFHPLVLTCTNPHRPTDLHISATSAGQAVALGVYCRQPTANEYTTQVYTPTTGATFHRGDTIWVRFAADPLRVPMASFYVSFDQGDQWALVSSSGTSYNNDVNGWWGNYPWVVKDSMFIASSQQWVSTTSTQCEIRASDYGGDAPTMAYSGTFTISR